ncbi:MAG: hypothetical protein NTU49_00280 [Gammaproteobacteria bacterium]|nr:hypothetical protein [Gammaproteobacteria bacterium]
MINFKGIKNKIIENMANIAIFLMIALMLSMLTELLSVFIFYKKIESQMWPATPDVVLVSTKQIVSDFTNSISKNTNLTSAQKTMLVKQFDTFYPAILKNYANQNNVIIFDNALPIQAPNTIKNITSDIENKIQAMDLKILQKQKENTVENSEAINAKN